MRSGKIIAIIGAAISFDVLLTLVLPALLFPNMSEEVIVLLLMSTRIIGALLLIYGLGLNKKQKQNENYKPTVNVFKTMGLAKSLLFAAFLALLFAYIGSCLPQSEDNALTIISTLLFIVCFAASVIVAIVNIIKRIVRRSREKKEYPYRRAQTTSSPKTANTSDSVIPKPKFKKEHTKLSNFCCSRCGVDLTHLRKDQIRWIDGKAYCDLCEHAMEEERVRQEAEKQRLQKEKELYEEMRRQRCYGCKEIFSVDDMVFVDGEYHCMSCFNKLIGICNSADEDS